MRSAWILPFLLAGGLWADETTDRRAIQGIIGRLNRSEDPASLFAAGADVPAELHRLDRAGCNLILPPTVWSEVPSPHFTAPKVQFLSPDLAVADLDYLRYSSVAAFVRAPVVVILERERGEWKIATLRVLQDCSGLLRILPAGR